MMMMIIIKTTTTRAMIEAPRQQHLNFHLCSDYNDFDSYNLLLLVSGTHSMKNNEFQTKK